MIAWNQSISGYYEVSTLWKALSAPSNLLYDSSSGSHDHNSGWRLLCHHNQPHDHYWLWTDGHLLIWKWKWIYLRQSIRMWSLRSLWFCLWWWWWLWNERRRERKKSSRRICCRSSRSHLRMMMAERSCYRHETDCLVFFCARRHPFDDQPCHHHYSDCHHHDDDLNDVHLQKNLSHQWWAEAIITGMTDGRKDTSMKDVHYHEKIVIHGLRIMEMTMEPTWT